MRNSHYKLVLIAGIAITLAACNPTKQDIGTIVGGGTGAFIGSHVGSGTGQLAAVAIGTRITSYNVCYTKLLRAGSGTGGCCLQRFLCPVVIQLIHLLAN